MLKDQDLKTNLVSKLANTNLKARLLCSFALLAMRQGVSYSPKLKTCAGSLIAMINQVAFISEHAKHIAVPMFRPDSDADIRPLVPVCSPWNLMWSGSQEPRSASDEFLRRLA